MADDSSNRDDRARRGGHLGFVAHEIRNPLSTALWSAELLTRMTAEERAGQRGEKLSAMCLRSIARVRQLVEDHLLAERLDSGAIPLRSEPIPLREALETCVQRRAADVGEVTIDVDPSLAVHADRMLLDRTLDALVAAAGGEGTPVRVSARRRERVEIEVAGRAPPDAALEDPVKGSPSDQKGRALALPLVRRIAAALGGGVSIRGGAFLLSLPPAQPYASRPEPPARP